MEDLLDTLETVIFLVSKFITCKNYIIFYLSIVVTNITVSFRACI